MTAVGINGAAFESQISSFVSVTVSQVSVAKTGNGSDFSSLLSRNFAKAQPAADVNTANRPAETKNTDQPGVKTDVTRPGDVSDRKETKTDGSVKTDHSKDGMEDGTEAVKKTDASGKTGEDAPVKAGDAGMTENVSGETDEAKEFDDCVKALEILNTLMQGIANILETTVNELQGCYDRLDLEPSTMFTVTNIQLTVITFEGLSDPSDLLVNNDALDLLNQIKEFVASVFEDTGMQFTEFENVVSSDAFREFIGPVETGNVNVLDILDRFTFDETGKLVVSDIQEVPEETSEETPENGIQVTVSHEDFEKPEDVLTKGVSEEKQTGLKVEANTAERYKAVTQKKVSEPTDEEDPEGPIVTVTKETENDGQPGGFKSGSQNLESRTQTDSRSVRTVRPGHIETPVEAFMQGIEQAVQTMELETPIAEGVTVRDIVYQIVDAIRVNISSDSTSLEMHLNPENLGRVNLNIESRGGVMTAQITTENETARAAIESQLQILKDNFEAQGVRVEAIEVTVSSFSFADSKNADAQAKEHPEDNMKVGRGRRNGVSGTETAEEETAADENRLEREVMEQTGSTVSYTA